ncbi:MAG: hypothetical protein KGY51_00115 [Psychroflexus sp.]|nr:hypothetical protein [Psychroflexus sp.]
MKIINKIIVTILASLMIQCKTPLYKSYITKGNKMEKIDIQTLDAFATGQKNLSKDKRMELLGTPTGDGISFRIKDTIENNLRVLDVTKINDKYMIITQRIDYKNFQEVRHFNSNGIMRSKEIVGIKEYLENDILGTITILNSYIGKTLLYDDKGFKTQEVDYDTDFRFDLDSLIGFLKRNYSNEKRVIINKKYFFSSYLTKDDMLEYLKENNIKVRMDYPYWIVNSSNYDENGNYGTTIILDGVTGEKVGEITIGPFRDALDHDPKRKGFMPIINPSLERALEREKKIEDSLFENNKY